MVLHLTLKMPRRKNGIVSDGDDSDDSQQSVSEGYNSQEDGDSRAERALFEQKHKRRRTGDGKADAWEGIFGEGDEDRGPRRGLGGRRGRGRGAKTDWTRYAPVCFTLADTDLQSSGVCIKEHGSTGR